MRTISYALRQPILDAYVYAGHLFAVFEDGTLRTLPLHTLWSNLAQHVGDTHNLLRAVMLRNDWFSNMQADSLLSSSIKDAFRAKWDSITTTTIDCRVRLDEWVPICTIPSLPIYDMRLYAMRLYMAHRGGTDEMLISVNERRGFTQRAPLSRILDARTIAIGSRIGTVTLSAESDGLFYGSIWGEEDNVKPVHYEPAGASIRIGWTGYDLLNYSTPRDFSYLSNDVTSTDQARPSFSLGDDETEKKRIEAFGVRSRSREDVLHSLTDTSNIRMLFNSSQQCFIVRDDGAIDASNIIHEPGNEHLSRNLRHIKPGHESRPSTDTVAESPCSACVVPNGMVLEYLDRVDVLLDGRATTLESKPAYSIRSFINSNRYRYQVLITHQDGLVFHVVPPLQIRDAADA